MFNFMFSPSTFVVLALSASAFSQDLGVPLSWRKFNNTRPREERIKIAQDAIDLILPQLDANTAEFKGIGFWQSGNVYSALAIQDFVANSQKNRDTVVKGLDKVFQLNKNFDKFGYFNDDAMWWAQSAVYANRAYKDKTLLDSAIATWNQVSEFQLTEEVLASGTHPVKKLKALQKTCDGVTMAGGVFWRPTPDDRAINSITTGLFTALSAWLGEATGDKKYTNAAIAAANWIKAHNINKDNLVLDTVNADDCSRSPGNWLFTYNSGKFVEGLSVLANTDKDSSDTWTQLLTTIANSAMKTRQWAGEDGIINEGANRNENGDGVGFKSVFIRGLNEALLRTKDRNLNILIHSYVDVQYNALLDLAAKGNAYSAAWQGPSQDFTTWGQMAALDVLVAAIDAN